MNLLSGPEIDYDDVSKSDNIECFSSKVKVVHRILHQVATMVEIINSVVAMVAFYFYNLFVVFSIQTCFTITVCERAV